MHWRRKWQPTPVFLPGESQGRQSLVGFSLWGRTESDTTDATQQQQPTLCNLLLQYQINPLGGSKTLKWTLWSVALPCLTSSISKGYSLPGPCPWNFPGKNTGASCHFLLLIFELYHFFFTPRIEPKS